MEWAQFVASWSGVEGYVLVLSVVSIILFAVSPPLYQHRATVQSLKELKIMIEALQVQNHGLTRRVAELERRGRENGAEDDLIVVAEKPIVALETRQEENSLGEEQKIAEDKRHANEKFIERERTTELHCMDLIRKNEKYPLLHAARDGEANDILGWLIDHHTYNVNGKDDYGRTPLHWAAINGHLPAVQYLLGRGADINSKGCYGDTPLHDAANNGHLQTVQHLVDRGATINVKAGNGDTPLSWSPFCL